MQENIVLSEQLQNLIRSQNYEEAKDYIYKNFTSDKKPFRNIEFLKDHLTKEIESCASMELKLSRTSNLFWFSVMTLLTIIQLFLWISPGQSGYPWLLILLIPGMLIFGSHLFDRSIKLTIDNNFLIVEHEEKFRIELTNILTGYIHAVSKHNRNILSKPDYYLTLISKDLENSKHINISDLDLSGWNIGAFLNFKMSKN